LIDGNVCQVGDHFDESFGGSVKYTLVVCAEEGSNEVDESELLHAFSAFEDKMRTRGVLVDTNRLRSTSTATTVKIRNGDLVIADGPFAETKEQIAGFYVVECSDLDDAIDVASQIPAAAVGTIEVRPNWEL
jgi:hypothetical protein